MSLLSYHSLLSIVHGGVITNCPDELVNQTSIDVTLAKHILVEQRGGDSRQPVVWKNKQPLNMVEIGLPHVLAPGEFILAASQQVFNLPNWLSAEYKLKSGMARTALNHLNAGWCDAGWHGSVLTLELVNCSRYHYIELNEGDRIGQMVFFRHAWVPEEASYASKGRYNNDRKVTATKL